jgi:hypothetical protein
VKNFTILFANMLSGLPVLDILPHFVSCLAGSFVVDRNSTRAFLGGGK